MGPLNAVIAATTEAGHSETPFFIVGSALAVLAVLLSVVGFSRPDFPGSDGAARGVIGLGAGVVVAVMAIVIWMNS
jgi:hypothetical protein